MSNMKSLKEDELRREIDILGTMLGDTIRDSNGDEAFKIVEVLRRAAWQRRALVPSTRGCNSGRGRTDSSGSHAAGSSYGAGLADLSGG